MKLFKNLYQFVIAPERLFYYYLAAMLVPNIALCFTEHYSIIASLCNVILPASVYAWLLTLKRRPGIMIWILFPFVFLNAFQLVLLYLFGNSIINVDMFLNVVTTNFNEATELLGNIVPAVAGVFILYLPALILGILSIIRRDKMRESLTRRVRKISLPLFIAGALLTGIYHIVEKDYDMRLHLFPANICYNLGLAVERSYDFSHYTETSAQFTYDASASHDKAQREIYVFVIGETGRACSWGLYGYERNTTPMLKKQKGVTAFTDVLTQSNTTHISVPMIMSPASAENYDQIYREKSIITAFKEAGFYTAFFSNQRFNHSFIDIFGNEADSVVFLKEGASADHNISDDKLLKNIDEILSEGHDKLFIVLHTYGSHFNYKERYPEDAAVFTPDEIIGASQETRGNLINAYDNTIVQTDKFLYNIIKRIDNDSTASALLYTSDHGEDIFDDARSRFLHSSPIPTYYQLHVPFIVWTSDIYNGSYPEIQYNINANKERPVSSNASAFHTMIDIAGINTPLLKDSLSLASDKYHINHRYFINDHNKPVPYKKVGLRKEDLEQFKKHNLSME